MATGICSYLGIKPTLNRAEIFPYLIMFIGVENIIATTKSVVSTPVAIDVRYRIALGLQKEAWFITTMLIFELGVIMGGLVTMVPAIQEFCMLALIGLLIDFFLHMLFFVTVLSIDLSRLVASRSSVDREQQVPSWAGVSGHRCKNIQSRATGSTDSYRIRLTYRRPPPDSDSETDPDDEEKRRTPSACSNDEKSDQEDERAEITFVNIATYVLSTLVELMFAWPARARMVQRAIVVLSLAWIVLISYKAMWVHELVQNNVSVRPDTLRALLHSSPPPVTKEQQLRQTSWMRSVRDRFQQLFAADSQSSGFFSYFVLMSVI